MRRVAMPENSPIRVTIVQPALAKYRIPVFRELASRPGLDLRVVYGSLEGLDNVAPEGFQAEPTRIRQVNLLGMRPWFQGAQWTNASHRAADVLVLQWAGRYLTVLPALLRARLSGVGTVLWGHGYSKAEHRPRQRLHKWLAHFATALLFYDPRTRDGYVQQGWDPRRLFVALNCVDHSEIVAARQWWKEHPSELKRFRAEQGLDQGPVIIFVSRLQPANRVDMLIRATAALAEEIPGLKTVIIGNGPAEKEHLKSLAAEVGATASVVFQDGIYDELKLAPWFLSADVFCYPANVGLSLIHALWYGLPIVTSNDMATQNPEIVALEHGVNGLTYEHGSVAALADALRQITTNGALRDSMSRVALRSVEDRFVIRNMVDGIEAAIRYANHRRHLTRQEKNRAEAATAPRVSQAVG
jgi:glycosyltransferase involved in cell wall biosynthesis